METPYMFATRFVRRYFSPNENGSGTGQNPGTGGNGDNPGGNPPAPGGNGNGTPGDTKTFSQTDLDAIAAKVRDEVTRKFERKAQETADEAKRKEDEKQGEFQKLYEQEKNRNEQLSKHKETAVKYAERINTGIDNETKDWPAEVKKSDPGNNDVEARLTWADNMRDLAKRLTVTPPRGEHGPQGTMRTNTGGNNQNPVARFTQGRYAVPGAKKP